MVGRWFYLLVVGIGVFVYMNAPDRGAEATVTQTCAADGTTIDVTLAWQAPEDGAVASYLDVGLSGDFPAYGYSAHGPLDAASTSYALAGLPAGVKYHYRINTLYGDGWDKTASGSFKTSCATPTPEVALTL